MLPGSACKDVQSLECSMPYLRWQPHYVATLFLLVFVICYSFPVHSSAVPVRKASRKRGEWTNRSVGGRRGGLKKPVEHTFLRETSINNLVVAIPKSGTTYLMFILMSMDLCLRHKPLPMDLVAFNGFMHGESEYRN